MSAAARYSQIQNSTAAKLNCTFCSTPVRKLENIPVPHELKLNTQ